MATKLTARPLEEWTEEDGTVLWWRFPIDEAPYVGSPLDLGLATRVTVETRLENHLDTEICVGGWPGYHTHWTPIECPEEPAGLTALKEHGDETNG